MPWELIRFVPCSPQRDSRRWGAELSDDWQRNQHAAANSELTQLLILEREKKTSHICDLFSGKRNNHATTVCHKSTVIALSSPPPASRVFLKLHKSILLDQHGLESFEMCHSQQQAHKEPSDIPLRSATTLNIIQLVIVVWQPLRLQCSGSAWLLSAALFSVAAARCFQRNPCGSHREQHPVTGGRKKSGGGSLPQPFGVERRKRTVKSGCSIMYICFVALYPIS